VSPTEAEVRRILEENGGLPVGAANLDGNADLFDLGMTSHASVNVMLALEDSFDIEFPDEMLRKSTFESVNAITAALGGLGAQAPSP
jgi:acyl carrier protein